MYDDRQYRPKRRRSLLPALFLVLIAAALLVCGVAAIRNLGWRSECPPDLISLYERNPDARDFVRNYPEKQGQTFPIDLSEYRDCTSVPLLMQWDERWGYSMYSGNLYGLSGCGPACLSMVAIYLTGDPTMDPLWMGQFSTNNGYSYDGQGTLWSLMKEGAQQLGLQVEQISLEESRVLSHLESGNPIICIMGPGDFTSSGHFIVLTGCENGNITVNDPNSYRNSETTWRYDELAGQIQSLWAYYK